MDHLAGKVENCPATRYYQSMVDFYIKRRLRIGEKYFSEAEALKLGRVFVVLAEPGAGKTDLLKELGRLMGVQPVRASIFRHRTRIQNGALVIDALDEAAKIDQSAVDEIVVKAQEHSNGQVVFASRSSEWQEARTLWIKSCFGTDPVVVHIEHFRPDEQRAFFNFHLPNEDFDAFAADAERFELGRLLGNPQFLLLFAKAHIQNGRHFTSKAQIFRDAVDRLTIEAGDGLAGRPRPPSNQILAIASEVMGKLLLAGAAGVSTRESTSDLDYPYLATIATGPGDNASLALDTRLFQPALEPDRHEPVHRIVAEYCAAQYLLGKISDQTHPLSLKRLLAVIAPNGAVRDELRGLLGWLASSGTERVQRAAINLDGYAVLANGDPSQLAPASKKLLLQKLEEIAAINPGFRRGDYWRRFSVGGFFTEEVADDVRKLLRDTPPSSPLGQLVLELLVDSGGPVSLAADVRRILLDPDADRIARMLAARALLRLTGRADSDDLDLLIQEGSVSSLRTAIDMITEAGIATVREGNIAALLRAFASAYPPHRRLRDDDVFMGAYYLVDLIKQIKPEVVARYLDDLTSGLACTCERPHYDCECRVGVSKVAGYLLDRYFDAIAAPHDAERIWQWIRSLWYRNRGDAKKNASIRALKENHALRHQLHRRAFQGVTESETAWKMRRHIDDGHHHSGLSFSDGDHQLMADYAFETDNVGLWAGFWSPPHSDSQRRGPDPLRRKLREQARQRPAFACAWAKEERRYRSARRKYPQHWGRRQRHWQQRKAQRLADDKAHLQANRAQVESGQHRGWVNRFAKCYFLQRDRLQSYTDDISLVENALRNCLPLIQEHMPTLVQLAGNESWATSWVAFASCWIQFRDCGTLEHIDRSILMPVRVEAGKYEWMPEDAYHAFEAELDRLLFADDGDAEDFARTYIEPGLAGPRDAHTHSWWLANRRFLAPLRAKLSLEWLQTYPEMPLQGLEELFNTAAATVDRAALLDLIARRIAALENSHPEGTDEEIAERAQRLQFWRLRQFFFDASDNDGWEHLREDPEVIFALDHRAGSFADSLKGWPDLTANKVFKILDTYVDVWPRVFLPNHFGTGDPPEERAYRFLTEIVWRIGHDAPGRALPVLDRLLADDRFNGFHGALRTQRAETVKKLALADFSAPSPPEIVSLLDASGIATVEDLRALVLEELEWLQGYLRTSETDPLATYYQNGSHVDENTARNRVVDGLKARMTALNLPVVIEHHMADSNRCDFTVSAMIAGRRRLLVVEAKGQWHPEVFTAAGAQLHQRYSSHQDAEQQGIYLVFWFGPETKVADRDRHGLASAEELRQRVVERMPPELRGLIDVMVLDVSWANASKAKSGSNKRPGGKKHTARKERSA